MKNTNFAKKGVKFFLSRPKLYLVEAGGAFMRFAIKLLSFFAVWMVTGLTFAFSPSESFVVDGYLTKRDNTPLRDVELTMRFYIMSPKKVFGSGPADHCVLYAEEVKVNTELSNGYFNVSVGSSFGATKRLSGVDSGHNMADIFDNSKSILSGKKLSNHDESCSYAPVSGEPRYLRVAIKPKLATNFEELTPYLLLGSVPSALVAETISTTLPVEKGGTGLGQNFWSVNDNIGKMVITKNQSGQKTLDVWECNYGELLSFDGLGRPQCVTLSSGDLTIPWSSVTGKPTTLSGYGITDAVSNAGGTPSVQSGLDASRPTAGTAGRVYISTDANKIYRDNGTTWVVIGTTNAGDLSAGTLPTGRLPAFAGDVTSSAGSNTMTIANNAVTSAKIADGEIVDADISASANIADTKLATISTAGKVSGNAITSGTIGGSTAINTSGAIVTSGLFRNSTTFANTGTSINWSNGNLQTTTASCGSFTFSNMEDGGTYTLIVQGSTSATCTFTQSGLTFRFVPANGPTIAGTQTVYTFLRAGSNVYVSWVTGYQ